MITVFVGENGFEIDREVKKIMAGSADTAERIEGGGLSPRDLPDVLLGTTLFSENRLVIMKDLSENRAVWTALADYISKVPTETHLILIEPRPDKRTKTYKTLQKHADIKELKLWSERESGTAERWVVAEAMRIGLTLQGGAARLLVARSLITAEKGAVIDQWRLLSNLEKLAPLGKVGPGEVETYIEETPVENVFGLFETALRSDAPRVKEMIGRLEASDDPFRLFGLLSGQVFWLAALAASDKPSQAVAKDFAAYPFILEKLAPYAKRFGAAGVRRITAAFAEADTAMKTSAADPWLLIERALLKVSQVSENKTSAK